MRAEDASCRCCATLSATRRRASILSFVEVAVIVTSGGMSSNELEGGSATIDGCASGEGRGGGREPVEEAIGVGRNESGVLTRDGGVESFSKFRFARSELRKA